MEQGQFGTIHVHGCNGPGWHGPKLHACLCRHSILKIESLQSEIDMQGPLWMSQLLQNIGTLTVHTATLEQFCVGFQWIFKSTSPACVMFVDTIEAHADRID